MMEKRRRLPDAELEVMLIVWHSGGPVTPGEVHRQLQGTKPWRLPTVVTVLERLTAKGYLEADKSGRSNLYMALVSEEEYRGSESRNLLEKLCGNSLRTLVASLYNGREISPEDLRELRAFLDESEGGGEK